MSSSLTEIIAVRYISVMNATLSGPFDTSQLPRIASAPVTVTVSRSIAPGREKDFTLWAEAMATRARSFPGSLGAGVLHPGPDGGDFQIVFRFVDGLALRMWERSPQRMTLLAEADEFVTAERVQRTVGIEDWFEMAQRAEPARPLWKRIATDVMWVYPVALLASVLIAPHLARIPLLGRTALTVGVITLVMRTAVGPVRSKLRAKRTL